MIYLDKNRREEAIEAGWLSYKERVPGFECQYRKACEGFDVIAIVANKVIGALFAKDGVIHLGIVPEWRGKWASRRLIAEMLEYGRITTLLPEETVPMRFITRLGFKQVGAREFVKESVCLS